METIHQEFNHVIQEGTRHEIMANTGNIDLTGCQIYFALTGLFLSIIFISFLIYKLSSAIANKSCMGCNRLKRCEKEIKNIKSTLALNEFVDASILEEIAHKVDELKQKVME